ncbi:MAG: ribonuclease D [Coriobacteriia bacterium]|nr:ribonuclease D [Coriobacteriia bacterium]
MDATGKKTPTPATGGDSDPAIRRPADARHALRYLDTDADFAAALEPLHDAQAIALDTEFMREKTYYAKLCLLQIASEHEVLLVDTLRIQDYHPLADLLRDAQVTKVFHAGGQDLEILYQACGAVVSSYFDTQDAAELLGYSSQIGYGALVSGELGVELSKSDSFTDWDRRPLTAAQLSYAADDVIWLLQLYPLLRDKLTRTGRLDWLREPFAAKTDLAVLDPDPRNAYLKVRRVSQLKGKRLAVVRELAAWREAEARRRNLPRRWVLSDESLIEVARRMPQTGEELVQIRGVDLHGRDRQDLLLAAVRAGQDLPQEEWPELKEGKRRARDVSAAVDLMAALVRCRAREADVSSTLLASRRQLEALALNPEADSPLLAGWRRELIGAELLQLLRGNLVLSLEGDRLKINNVAKDSE